MIDGLLAESRVWMECFSEYKGARYLFSALVIQRYMEGAPIVKFLKDGKTGQPLFNKSAWKSAKNILALVQNGYLSDPPGIALYYQIGLDSKHNGLPIYRCMRGTNMTEGGVHKQIRSRVPVSGVSPRHMYACLLDFILRHNLLVRL